MNKRRIVLMCSANFIEPFKKEGFEVFWTLSLVYPLFYEKKGAVSVGLEEFKARLNSYREKVLEFSPGYFLADQGFFAGILGRLEVIKKDQMRRLWIDFIEDLNRKGIVTIISCVDDPRQFIIDKKYVRQITHSFKIVKACCMRLSAKYIKEGQGVVYFPNYVRIYSDLPFRGKEDPLLEDRISKGVFDFDLFFTGNMNRMRKVFFRRLSRKVKDLDFFFGSKDFFYTSRNKIDFDLLNRFHLMEIYKRTAVNIIYGNLNEYPFIKTWASSDRAFNIGYCRGFFIHDYRNHLIDLFDIDHKLYTFKGLGECDKKIRFYLKNPHLRKELSDKFHAQVMERHTVDKRVRQFVHDIEKIRSGL